MSVNPYNWTVCSNVANEDRNRNDLGFIFQFKIEHISLFQAGVELDNSKVKSASFLEDRMDHDRILHSLH